MSLKLHPTEGVNPRMGVCVQCGEGTGVVLLGANNKKRTCNHCNTVNYGASSNQKCGKCKELLHNAEVATIDEHEKLPNGLCDSCTETNKDCEELVKNGGIFFRCLKCKTEGAVKGDTDLAINVRKKLELPAPELCGIELPDCPQCREDADD